MVDELQLALVSVLASAFALTTWIVKKLIETLTTHLSTMTANQAKIATLLEVLASKLALWDERWIDIKMAVDKTIRGGPP